LRISIGRGRSGSFARSRQSEFDNTLVFPRIPQVWRPNCKIADTFSQDCDNVAPLSTWACPPSAGLTSSASFERPIGGAVKNPPLFHLKKDRRDPLDRASASRCPSCGAAEQTVLTRTVAAVYFGCNACGHLWSLPKRGQELSAPLEIEFLQTD